MSIIYAEVCVHSAVYEGAAVPTKGQTSNAALTFQYQICHLFTYTFFDSFGEIEGLVECFYVVITGIITMLSSEEVSAKAVALCRAQACKSNKAMHAHSSQNSHNIETIVHIVLCTPEVDLLDML